jgi:hypothetical protein
MGDGQMITAKKIAYAFAGMALCSIALWGCSEDRGKKEEKKTVTVQEQMGKEAAQTLQKPLEEARKTAVQVEAKTDQALKDIADGTKKSAQEAGIVPTEKGSKEKKKLEGC